MDNRKVFSQAHTKEVYVGINEDSVRKRKLRMKSTTTVKTTIRMHLVTSALMEKTVADKKYDDYHGSTRNDMISLIVLPAFETMWNMPVKMKHDVYNHVDGNRRFQLPEARTFK
jgi:beta-galactosidase GanA